MTSNLIVVGVDGSEGGRRALRWAVAEALTAPAHGARMLVLGSHGHGHASSLAESLLAGRG